MKRIGYILGTRIRGPVDLGPLGSLIVALTGRFGGVLSVTDTTAAPNGLTGSIQTMGGIGVMGESAFEANVRIQGRLLCNANLLVAGAVDVTGGVILNGTLNCGAPVVIAPGQLLRAMGNAFLEDEVRMTGVPGADPHQVGEIWNNGGVATISAG